MLSPSLRKLLCLGGTEGLGMRYCSLKLIVPVLLLVVAIIAFSACNDVPGLSPESGATPAPALAAYPDLPPEGDAESSDLPDNRQLVVWLPDFAGFTDEGSAAEVLTSAFHQFEQEHPGVRVDVQVKAESGQSDLFSFLLGSQRVAPAIMPDLVLLNSSHLWQLADHGLLLPMPGAPMDHSPDFYPFAVDSVEYNGQWYGVPYAADVMHLVGLMTEDQPAPVTWNELLSQSQPYLFSAAGSDVFENGSVLLQYVGAGGQLLENGSTSSVEALRAVFDFLVDGKIRGIVQDSATELATLDAVWNALVEGGQGYGNVSAARYLANRESIPEFDGAQIPTRNGLPITVASTWAFAVLGEDEEQRALAFNLIDDLLDPAVQGAWSQYVHRLPTQRSALQVWSNPSAYTDFLNRQLEVAVGFPNGRAFADFADRVLAAQLGVLRGEITPTEAVEAVSGPG